MQKSGLSNCSCYAFLHDSIIVLWGSIENIDFCNFELQALIVIEIFKQAASFSKGNMEHERVSQPNNEDARFPILSRAE